MAKKKKDLSKIVTINWRILLPLLIGLFVGAIVFMVFMF